jgi:hypothetical protein
LSKIKCFICHKHDHYASQCPEKKKGKGKQQQNQVATSTETQMSEFASKFEKDFLMVSCLSTSTVPRNAWYVDNGASRHMTSARELFSSLTEQDSRVQVELGDDAKYPVAGVGTIPFQLQSGNSLDFDDVLFVLGLRKNLLSVSVMEDKGFAVEFKNQQVLIKLKESSPEST